MSDRAQRCDKCELGCACQRYKATPRDEELRRQLQNRLNRILGQVGGIKKMLDENRYCGDILTQIAAVESALQALGYMVLRDHMTTCMSEQLRAGNEGVIDEAVELIKKLK